MLSKKQSLGINIITVWKGLVKYECVINIYCEKFSLIPFVISGKFRIPEFWFHTKCLLQVKVSVKRVRREFGAPANFSDRNVSDAKDAYIECTSYEDRSFDVKKEELDMSTQVWCYNTHYRKLYL